MSARKVLAAALVMAAAIATLSAVPAMGQSATTPKAPFPVTEGAAPIDLFPPANSCGCHAALGEQWSQSMHAKALQDPAFQLKLKQAQDATDGKLGAFCNKCHGPAAVMAGELSPGGKLSESGAEGIQCSFCHQVVGTEKPPANTSQLMSTGVFRAQLEDPQCPHPAQYNEFHKTAEFCGACHDVLHPINGMHLESAYAEWKKSPYAKQGIVCQNCHMGQAGPMSAPYSGQACATGPQRDNIFAMSFPGGNVAQGNPELTTLQLQSAAEVAIETPQVATPGQPSSAKVTVTNVGAGHSIPTGLTEVRQMWLEVSVVGADGQSKLLKEHQYGTVLKDAKGKHPVELWEAVDIYSDDRIPPKGSSIESVTVDPLAEDAAVTVVAELKYKSLPDDFAKEAGVDNPVTVMAKAEQKVFGSEAAREAELKGESTSNPASNNTVWWVAGILVVVVLAIAGVLLMRRRRA